MPDGFICPIAHASGMNNNLAGKGLIDAYQRGNEKTVFVMISNSLAAYFCLTPAIFQTPG